jgi:hypothetical protein
LESDSGSSAAAASSLFVSSLLPPSPNPSPPTTPNITSSTTTGASSLNSNGTHTPTGHPAVAFPSSPAPHTTPALSAETKDDGNPRALTPSY